MRTGRRRGATDPVAVARGARPRYVNDESPGIRRVKHARAMLYLGPDGRSMRDPETLARIRALAMPLAWTEVWICPCPDGHILVTGRDARADAISLSRDGGASGTRPSTARRRRRANQEMSRVRGLNCDELVVLALLMRRLAEEDHEDQSARSAATRKAPARRRDPGRPLHHPARS
jgi:hypothetical protein